MTNTEDSQSPIESAPDSPRDPLAPEKNKKITSDDPAVDSKKKREVEEEYYRSPVTKNRPGLERASTGDKATK
jgi:hypothetical protein